MLYIALGLLLLILLVWLLIRHVSNTFETFQNQIVQMDASGADLNVLANEIRNLNINTTEVDSRPLNDNSRVCDTIQSQINTLKTTKETYRSLGDWSNVKLSNRAIEDLEGQLGTLGCQNNNTQNN
jgi:predicted PurR-regulated permease PerM